MSASFVQHVRCLSVLIKASGCGRPKTAALLHTKMYLKHSVYLRQSVAQRNQTQTPPIAFDLQFLCKVWKYYLNCRDCRVAAVDAVGAVTEETVLEAVEEVAAAFAG